MRTLVVEDDDLQRQMLTSHLSARGHEVHAVADGGAGLFAQLRAPYDLLVIDWVMPELDGLALINRIRTVAGDDMPYVLVVTGRDRPADLDAVLDAGADDYIAKPVDPTLLGTRIRIAEQRIATHRRHQQARRDLARSEVEFRRVIERCPLGIFAFVDSEVVYVNASAARALGAEREELTGRRVLDLIAPDMRALAERRLERFERTDVPPPAMEAQLTCADGSAITTWLIPMTRALLDGRRATFVMFEDVTERRAADRKLRLTQFAMDHAADPALWLRRDGTIVYANHAACTTLGYPRPELSGMDVSVLDDSGEGGTAPLQWLSAQGPSSVKTALRTASGRSVSVEISTNVLRFDGEEIVVAFARDLSERERMAAKLQKADRLASVGSLAAGVAHEINNPLAYVIANLEVLEEELRSRGDVDPAVERTLQEALDGAERVARIVGDLKSFARADDDEVQAVDVHQVLDTAADIAANEIRHRAKLMRTYGEVPLVQGNPGRLTQVFLNLLVNAAHAIDEDGGDHRISIHTRSVADGVVVEISDTGCGIPPQMIDRVFDPFFTTKPQGMGTGLGLSICHGIITSIGGEIRVDSEPGRGSTFRVHLRRAEPLAATSASDRMVRETGPLPARPLNILVVDDEPLIGEGIRRALRGHRVEVASGGREAIERCAEDDFDLVLCDVMMPDVSGMEVYGRISNARPGWQAKFVFMTGGAFTPKARDFLASIEAEHLEKPFSLRELRTLVNRRAESQ